MTNFPIPSTNKVRDIFEKQWINLFLIFVSIILFYYFSLLKESMSGSTVFSLSIVSLYWIAFSIPIIHQLYVWICWRLQLYYNFINSTLGLRFGFFLYAIGFGILFVSRFIFVLLLAIGNQGSLEEFKIIFWILIVVICPVILYSFYSVKEFFGIKRAFGLDHFDPETHKLPMVNKGMYKYVSNSMYWFALLILFLPGLFYASLSGLLIAGFNYSFIWVHYFTVEKPDMRKIYS